MRKLFILLACLSGSPIFAQLLTADQVKTDIDTVISVLTDIHPTFYKTSNKDDLLLLRDTLDTALSCHELFKLLQPLIALDGHTTLQFTGDILPEVENPLLPFETVIYDNRLYVKHNLSADSQLKKATEILMINGTQVSDIIGRILTFVPGERPEYKIRKLDNAAFPNWYRLLYGNYDTFEIGYAFEGGIRTTTVKGVHWNSFNGHQEDLLKLNFPEPGIAGLKIGRFTHPGEFLPFIDSAFTEIQKRKCDQLIIDMTEGGGFSMLTDSLMNYITEEPYCSLQKKKIRISRESAAYINELGKKGEIQGPYFTMSMNPELHQRKSNQFKGDVYILCGPGTYSASAMFVAMATCFTDAVIVGDECGQPLISNGDISRHPLPNSGLNLYTSHSIYYFPCSSNKDDVIHPDIEVQMTLDDLLNDRNAYLNFTIGKISSQNETPARVLKGHEWSVTTLDINKEGDMLLSGSWDNTMILWDLNHDSVLCQFGDHSDMIWDVAFSHNEEYVASASWDASINIWDIGSLKLLYKLQQEPKFKIIRTEPFYEERVAQNMVNTIAFSPDDKVLASGSSDGIIRIWDLESGRLRETIDVHDAASVNSLVFDQSGDRLISSSDKIIIYNLKIGSIERMLDGHHGQLIGSLAVDHSGQLLISGDIATRDPLIILWDLETGDKIHEYKGHTKVIRELAFSNSDVMIASVGEDNQIKIWSVLTGDPVMTFSDNDDMELNAVCFSRDDQMIIYGSQDKTIKFREIGSPE